MKLAALAVVSLLPVALFAPAPRPEVGFAAAAPKAGSKQAVAFTDDVKMTMVVSMGGQEMQKMELPQNTTITCDVKFSANDAGAASIVFGDCSQKMPNPFGAAAAEPTSYTQKCYLIKPSAAGPVVTPDAGEGEMTDDGKKATDMMVVHLVGPAPLAPLLAGKTVKKGDKIEVPADVAQKCFGLFADEAKVSALTLVLAEEPDAAADAIVFQATAKMAHPASEEMPGEMTMAPAGTWSVSKSTCRVVAMAMKGPVTMRGTTDQGGMKIDMKADGEWTLAWSVATK
jgi:hypothetical protein